jgi:DNA-binding NtrC family response regulator
MSLDSAVFPLLQEHPWPGNVRELRNVIQRCAIVATDSVVRVDDVRDVM